MRSIHLICVSSFVACMILSCLLVRANKHSQLPIAPPPSEKWKADQAPKWLMDTLNDEMNSIDAEVRAHSLDKMGSLLGGCYLTIPSLVGFLKDPDAKVRQQAATYLGYYSDKRPLQALQQCLDDTDPMVRVQAAEALYRITGVSENVVPVLVRSLAALKKPDIPSIPEERANWIREYGAGLISIRLLGDTGQGAKSAMNDLVDLWNLQKEKAMGKTLAETIAKIDPERAKELGINPEDFAKPTTGTPPLGAGGRN